MNLVGCIRLDIGPFIVWSMGKAWSLARLVL